MAGPPGPRPRAFGQRINRVHSPVLATCVPWISVMLASLVPHWLTIASAPLFPPLGFLTFVAWRQVRPGLIPVWAGLPLGLFDDLYSGQPFGSGVLLWSLGAIAMEIIETRYPWRGFVVDWMGGAAIVALYILAGLGLANSTGGSTGLTSILLQVVLAVCTLPLVGRLVGWLDRLRLTRFKLMS